MFDRFNMLSRGTSLARASLRLTAAGSSSSAVAGRRGKQTFTIVQLLQDVDKLGLAGDRVEVATGRARNQLVGTGRAKFLPWKRRSEREALRQTARLIDGESSAGVLGALPAYRDIADILDSLPTSLSFPKRAISPKTRVIHGSVALQDVMQKLTEEYGLTSSELSVRWKDYEDDARMKDISERTAVIVPRRGAEREIQIEVTRIED